VSLITLLLSQYSINLIDESFCCSAISGRSDKEQQAKDALIVQEARRNSLMLQSNNNHAIPPPPAPIGNNIKTKSLLSGVGFSSIGDSDNESDEPRLRPSFAVSLVDRSVYVLVSLMIMHHIVCLHISREQMHSPTQTLHPLVMLAWSQWLLHLHHQLHDNRFLILRLELWKYLPLLRHPPLRYTTAIYWSSNEINL
jgi:hypothetical protein